MVRWFARRSRAPQSAEEQQRQQRSQDELRHGRLPLSAQERLASDADEHTFTSDLSAGDLAALRASGYVPVGQAFGAAAVASSRQFAYLDQAAFAPGGAINRAIEVHGWFDGERRARDTAQRRLIAECRALGGDGVVGVRRLGGIGNGQLVDCSLVGTAVRSVGRGPADQPFLTAFTAPEFTALIRGGWRPAALAFALSCWVTGGYSAWAAGGRFGKTRELPGLSDLQARVRADLRRDLDRRVRSVGTGLLLHRFDVRVDHDDDEIRCVGDALGTVITRLPRTHRSVLEVSMVLPLSPVFPARPAPGRMRP